MNSSYKLPTDPVSMDPNQVDLYCKDMFGDFYSPGPSSADEIPGLSNNTAHIETLTPQSVKHTDHSNGDARSTEKSDEENYDSSVSYYGNGDNHEKRRRSEDIVDEQPAKKLQYQWNDESDMKKWFEKFDESMTSNVNCVLSSFRTVSRCIQNEWIGRNNESVSLVNEEQRLEGQINTMGQEIRDLNGKLLELKRKNEKLVQEKKQLKQVEGMNQEKQNHHCTPKCRECRNQMTFADLCSTNCVDNYVTTALAAANKSY